MYAKPAGPPGFGDILDADWFHAAYIRRDAVSLAAGPALRGGGQTWQEAEPAHSRDTLLAHGRRVRAILLNDPCEIDSVLGHRGGSRLLVAGVAEWSPEATSWLEAGRLRDFRRHLLPPADGFEGGVVQFSSLFLVVDRCVQDARRLWSLDRRAQVNLEVAWEAYAVRRGPKAVADNSRKLAAILTAPGDEVIGRDVLADPGLESPEATAAKTAINEALEAAWEIEGGRLNDVADTVELLLQGSYSEPELRRETEARRSSLRDAFLELRAAADAAVIALGGDAPGAVAEQAGA
jgi:hypothetical protein